MSSTGKGRSSFNIWIICTLGPSSLDARVIHELAARGVDLFRINLSHTALEDVESTVEFIRRHSNVPISLDTEGAQVRCGPVVLDLQLLEGAEVELVAREGMGNAQRLTLRPAAAVRALTVGAHVAVDFHGAILRVTHTRPDGAWAVVERGGRIGSNKGVVVTPAPSLPPLTDKDVAAIAIGRRMGIEHYALSFAASEDDVLQVRELVGPQAHVISKIESLAGVRGMDGIIEASDGVLIDRGDLSREVPLEHVPYVQKAIVRRANRWHKPLFVATNLLESMVLNSNPTIAEVNDIANTLIDGAHGLVLAAETAIGIDPVGAVDMVKRAIEAFEQEHASNLADRLVPDGAAVALERGVVVVP